MTHPETQRPLGRCLVTGGAGFIGSHLAERLHADGHRVTVLDDLSAGSIDNLAAVAPLPGLEFVEGTVTDPDTVHRLVRDADTVFHLAANVGVLRVMEQGLRTLDTNLAGTRNVLQAAGPAGPTTVLTSSSEVYGLGASVPFSEDDPVVLGPISRARWVYAATKLADEAMALSHLAERGVPVAIARLFNAVGPRQAGDHGMVLPRFVERAAAGRPLQVYGDGSQTRTFCDVGDIVDALVRIAESPVTTGSIFNVGSDCEISIIELARRVVTLLESESILEFVPIDRVYPGAFDDIPRRVPELSRIREAIGWRPRIPLEATVASIRRHLGV